MTRRPADATQPEVFGLNHAAYRCRDAQETCEFYEGVLGFPLVQALDIEGHPTTGEPIHYMHVFFDIGGHDPESPNHLAFFEVPDLPGHEFQFKRQWGMDLHFAITVLDHAALETWRKRLVGRGVQVEGPIDHEMFTSIYFHDPNGYRLEFAAQNDEERRLFLKNKADAHAALSRWSERKNRTSGPAASAAQRK